MKSVLIKCALIGAALVALASCNSSSDDPNPGNRLICNDIVTYEGNAEGSATFTFQKEGDSPLITLTSSRQLNANDFRPGSRILISYSPESDKQYTSGPITLIAAMNVEGKGADVTSNTAQATSNWLSEPINVAALFRSGDYINVQFTGALGSQTPVTNLYVDEATLDKETPELHLIFGPYTGVTTTTYYFYGSWNIASIWNRPNCRSIKVMYTNAGGAIGGTVTITKGNDKPVKPDQPL